MTESGMKSIDYSKNKVSTAERNKFHTSKMSAPTHGNV